MNWIVPIVFSIVVAIFDRLADGQWPWEFPLRGAIEDYLTDTRVYADIIMKKL